MIETVLALMDTAACLLCAWVAGCYLLSLNRPRTVEDLLLQFGVLGVFAYGIGNALAPLKWELIPSAIAVGWRVAIALVAAVFYSRAFGWRVLWRQICAVPARWIQWGRRHVEAGRNRTGRS